MLFRSDITQAVQQLAIQVQNGTLQPQEISEQLLAQYLNVPQLPEPDLLIRTSGEQRVSNFMLWQMAYSELYFTNTLWPDFGETDMVAAIDAYNQRQRRFGKIDATIQVGRNK